jgi:formylglycine-generating enzyme required for sulfatase activity
MLMRICRSFFYLLYICLSLPVQAETPALPASHAALQKDCFSCHQDEEHREAVMGALRTSDQCTQCHAAVTPDASEKGVLKIAANGTGSKKADIDKFNQQHGIKEAEEEAMHKKGKQKMPVTAGMQFPMYYQGSRLGAEPNEMVLVPAGKFIMGSNERLPDEGPQHTVYLDAYYIDKYEVTNLQYANFNNATNRRSPTHFRNRTFPQGKADHPVTYVSWEDADAYCRWAGKRLPTDEEWEKAARGTDGRWFPWGDEFDAEKANTPIRWQDIGAFGDTTPAGSFEGGKSPYGVYDMSGNVWEWTASWYKAYPNNKTPSESYGERYKTLKGGSWFDCSFYKCGISAPVFNRAFFSVKVKNDSFGFRCAKDADAATIKKNNNNPAQ